jgi:feruloyl esterase
MVVGLTLGGTRSEAATSCTNLTSLKIPASEITLPTSGATIASAQMASVPADPVSPGATREYCKVVGAIAPVDPNAPPINFEINLPMQWNGKAVQYGGGGSNGTLVSGLGALRDARRERLRHLGNRLRPPERQAPRAARLRVERRVVRQHGLRVVQEDL